MNPVTAASLGIDLAQAQGHGLYKWLLASFLMGKRIRTTVAIEAYRNLVDRHGLDTPGKLARCTHRTLVGLLGQAGYARYDESTARRLHAMATRLEVELPAQLQALARHAQDLQGFQDWVLGFTGVGPKTLEIFMGEASCSLTPLAIDQHSLV
ncbi:hypothetical protein D3C81_329640 [compost metagenome]